MKEFNTADLLYVYYFWICFKRPYQKRKASWLTSSEVGHGMKSSTHYGKLNGLVACFHLPICIWFEFLIMDSSVFSVIFDKTGLNDASLANDTRKICLSVHYCFFRFLSDWFLLSLLFFPFIIKLSIICCQVCLAFNNCIQMSKLFSLWSLQRSEQMVLSIDWVWSGRSNMEAKSLFFFYS